MPFTGRTTDCPEATSTSTSTAIALSLTLTLTACAAPAEDAPAASTIDNATVAQIISGLEPRVPVAGDPGWTLEERMVHHRVPALSVAVWNDYELVWTAAFGYSDMQPSTEATVDTLFQAGSISKPVAATAVLLAAQRGELDLDAPINSMLESWKLPDNELTEKADVTPRRLLSHTAGTTVHGFPGYAVDAAVPTVPQVLDGAAPTNTAPVRVDVEPGTIFRYSGGGSTIMQLAMSDRAGIDYPAFMRREVLDPLGMTNSTYLQPLPPDWLERAAAGYHRDGRPVYGKRHTYPEMAAAGLWTTASDLALFGLDLQRALRGDEDTLLSRETVREMITPVLGESGLGLFEIESEGAYYFGHNGADEGFQALFLASREGGHGVAMMANSDNGIRLAVEVLPSIARTFGWPGFAPEPLVPAEVDPSTFDNLVGSYQLRDFELLEVTRDDDRLMARLLLDSLATRLVPTEDGTFIAQDDGSELRFEIGEDGRATGYINVAAEEATIRPRVEAAESFLTLLDSGETSAAIDQLRAGGMEERSLNGLGYTLLRRNRPKQAVEVFRLVVEQHPGSANAYDSLGDGYLALDDSEGAAEAFRMALETLPGDDTISDERKPSYESRAKAVLERLAKGDGS